MAKKIDSRIPEGPIAEKWTNYKAHQRLVNPKNKLKLDVIVVLTLLPHRVVSMQPRTIRTTATLFTVSSTIQ